MNSYTQETNKDGLHYCRLYYDNCPIVAIAPQPLLALLGGLSPLTAVWNWNKIVNNTNGQCAKPNQNDDAEILQSKSFQMGCSNFAMQSSRANKMLEGRKILARPRSNSSKRCRTHAMQQIAAMDSNLASSLHFDACHGALEIVHITIDKKDVVHAQLQLRANVWQKMICAI